MGANGTKHGNSRCRWGERRVAGNAPDHGLSCLFFLLWETGRDVEGVDADAVGGGAQLASGDREGQPFVWGGGMMWTCQRDSWVRYLRGLCPARGGDSRCTWTHPRTSLATVTYSSSFLGSGPCNWPSFLYFSLALHSHALRVYLLVPFHWTFH